jgi:hypothetical protein
MARDRVSLHVFALALAVYVLTAGGSLATTDAVVTWDVTKNIVERHTLAMSGNLLGMDAHRGADGRYYSPFGIAQSVYNIPFYLAGQAAGRAWGTRLGSPDTITKAAVALGNTVAAAGTVAIFFSFALYLCESLRGALAATLVLAFGTLLWAYSKFGFNAPLAALCLTASARSLWIGSRGGSTPALAGAGALAGAAFLTRHELILFVVPIATFLIAEARRRHSPLAGLVLPVLPGIAAAVGLWMALNAWRFGNPFDSGYLRDPLPAFGSSLASGLYGLLLSPGASLFLYCPVVVLAIAALPRLWKADRPTALFVLTAGLGCLIFYAQLGNWFGGRSYGPRYLVPVLPVLCLPLAGLFAQQLSVPARRTVWVVCALSVLVQIPSVLVDFSKVSVAWARQQDGSLPDRRLEWQASPMLLNTRAALEAVPRNVRLLARLEPIPPVERTTMAGDREFSQRLAFSLDFWWLYLHYLGTMGTGTALALAGGLILVAAIEAGQLARAWRTGGAT